MLFDMCVYGGGLYKVEKETREINRRIRAIPSHYTDAEIEVTKMIIIAEERGADVQDEVRADFENRLKTIAKGSGVVHGIRVNLEKDYEITLDRLEV